ncbi:MAG: CsbD family protein [Thermoanaerobaculia bacterium]
MNQDERTGKKENLKGRLKEAAGILIDDKDLEKEGSKERAVGETRETIGKARRKVGEAIQDLGKKIKR